MLKRLTALCLALPAAALADEPLVAEEIIVSGGRTPIEASAYGRAHSVVTAAEIEERQLRDLPEILRALPGVSVSRTGPASGLTQVRLRGSEGNHVLVLIDGVEVSAPQSGEYDFAGLVATDIERVEVLRGPQSAFYGSNATAGVISIITRRGRRNSFDAGGTLEAGSNGSSLLHGYISGGSQVFDMAFSATARNDRGVDVSNDPGGKSDRDRNITVNGKFNLDLTDRLRVGGNARFTDRRADSDEFNFGAATRAGLVTESNDRVDRRELLGSIYATLETFGGRMEHTLRLDYFDGTTTNFVAGAASSDTRLGRVKAGFQTLFAIDATKLDAADHTLALALEWETESFRNLRPDLVFDPSQLEQQERTQYGLAAEYRGTFFRQLDLQVGLRYDLNDDFADAFTYSLGASYILEATDTRFHASVGTGVTNPTFFEQFGFIPASFTGNPALEPEENFGWDAGIEQSLLDGRLIFDVTYFRERLENEITTIFPPPAFVATVVNQPGTSNRQGIEVSATARPIEGLDLGLSYTWLDATESNGRVETRRPRHEGSITATYTFLDERATLSAGARMALQNYDTDFTAASFGTSLVRLDDYVVVDIAGAYRMTPNVEIIGRVENLTDADYQELDGYASPGLTGFAGVRLTF